ncbi:MAG: serine dehydratase subunit alpha family protein [Erysipelotrichaceae bacterium]|nr:serine dehydratase subunit alpha family protein [Erysipelotrichaceae bacterium]
MKHEIFCEILRNNMEYATGCTEPAAVALCAAFARKYLEGDIQKIEVEASINIIKNVFSVGIPNTDRKGLSYAAALGAIAGNPDKKLQVIDSIGQKDVESAIVLVDSGNVTVKKKETDERLFIGVLLSNTNNYSRCIISGSHTNVTLIEKNGRVLYENMHDKSVDFLKQDENVLNLQNIVDFVNELDRTNDDLKIIEDAIYYNSEIAMKGHEHGYNLETGRQLNDLFFERGEPKDLLSAVMISTANGVDARMAGLNHTVVTNSGSGNQGITCTVPVLEAGKYLGKEEDAVFRAVTLSHLVSIYIHRNFGLLSALCGAVIAATAASCGISYLMGGSIGEINCCINNMLGTLSGMLCDGAKADCSMKVATCCASACFSAYMAMHGKSISNNEGIVEKEAKDTIKNFVRLSDDCSEIMDETMIDIMLNKIKTIQYFSPQKEASQYRDASF